MDWKTVEEKIILDDQNKWDRKATGQQFRISQTGQLELNNGEKKVYSLSDLAVSQLCQKLEIPVTYYRRLPDAIKTIMAEHDFKRLSDQSFLLRGKGEWIRAFLSGRYVAFNNGQIAEIVQTLLEEAEVSVKNFVLEETHMFLKIISEDLVDPETGLKAVVMVGNSEVGLGSISVEPFVFRKACTNDLVVARENSFRHPHIHLNTYELSRRIAEGISTAFVVASRVLDTFLATRIEPIPDPVSTIRRLATERKFSQKFTDDVVSRYQAEPESNRFGVINAFTSAAQNLAPLQRIEMERFAGSLLGNKF